MVIDMNEGDCNERPTAMSEAPIIKPAGSTQNATTSEAITVMTSAPDAARTGPIRSGTRPNATRMTMIVPDATVNTKAASSSPISRT